MSKRDATTEPKPTLDLSRIVRTETPIGPDDALREPEEWQWALDSLQALPPQALELALRLDMLLRRGTERSRLGALAAAVDWVEHVVEQHGAPLLAKTLDGLRGRYKSVDGLAAVADYLLVELAREKPSRWRSLAEAFLRLATDDGLRIRHASASECRTVPTLTYEASFIAALVEAAAPDEPGELIDDCLVALAPLFEDHWTRGGRDAA